MNSRLLNILVAALALFSFIQLHGQSSYQIGALPLINLHHKLPNNWSLNFKHESRHVFQSGISEGPTISEYDYVLSDFGGLASKKFGLNSKVGGGYLIRLRDDEMIHRFIQQYTFVQQHSSLRFAHRIVSDQTLTPELPATFRLRYRLASEIPLSGQVVDVKELYIKLSGEALNILQNNKYGLELRAVPLFGYVVHQSHKLELGVDYRFTQNNDHRFWGAIKWYIEF